MIEVDRDIGIEAHRLCRTHTKKGLLRVDAIHLACALRAGSDVLLTWDGPLSTITHEKIRIEPPRILSKDFFSETEMATDEIKAYEDKQKAAGKLKLLLVPSTIQRCGGDSAVAVTPGDQAVVPTVTKKASGESKVPNPETNLTKTEGTGK